ncbi:MAG TPA: MIP family channel protein [Ktedonobacteraceae bacterium]|nr:MIP family channel protein [Ktedonobacteraceae bacterium]
MADQATTRTSSLYSGLSGELIGEFFGTLVLLLFGDGCVATFALFTNIGPNNAATPFANEWTVIILGWGLAVMLGIYVAGALSGAHINPAVTLAFAATGKFPWSKVIPYWIAQVAGGFIAALILYFVYQGALVHSLQIHGLAIGQVAQSTTANGYGWVFYTYPKAFVGTFGAFGDEFIGTALLVGLIFAIVDIRNQPVQANLNPLIIGLLIVAIGASFGLNTGYAINPARDFGPRLWIAIVSGGASLSADNYYFWIPIVAPLVGGVVGGLIYEFTIHRALEAKGLLASGDAEVRGEAVREPGESAGE